jgi:CYTH domain-containing protein
MVKQVQAGQIWRNNENGANFLVTKVYSELFTQYAMLRPANVSAPESESIRVRVARQDNGMTLPGYTFTQDSQEF